MGLPLRIGSSSEKDTSMESIMTKAHFAANLAWEGRIITSNHAVAASTSSGWEAPIVMCLDSTALIESYEAVLDLRISRNVGRGKQGQASGNEDTKARWSTMGAPSGQMEMAVC